MTLEEIKQVAVPACREFKVKRLDLFGSRARGEGATASDIDLLVEFEEPDLHPAKRFFGLLHHLEDALGCEVDLLTISTGFRQPLQKWTFNPPVPKAFSRRQCFETHTNRFSLLP